VNRLEEIKEYLSTAVVGIRNIHFFRMGILPRLLAALSEFEKKLLLAAIAALLVSGSFLVTASYLNGTIEKPNYGGSYTEGLVGQPRYINPALTAGGDVDSDITRIIYSGLLRFDSSQTLVTDLAEQMPEISADQKQYTIKLREGLVWHDGVPITADDVVFTIRVIQNAAYQSPLRFVWAKVDVRKSDDRTIVFTLKEPSAPFLPNLTQGILPKHIWESIEPVKVPLSKYNLQPIGSGPFMLKTLRQSEDGEILSLTLTAFDRYAGGRPYLDQVELKFYSTYDDLISAYHSKDIQGLGYVPFDKKIYVEKSSQINLYNVNLPQYQALFLNRAKAPILSERAVRQALAESVNRDQIVSEAYLEAAQPSYGPIPPGYLGYNGAIQHAYLYDIEAAKKLLDDAGYKLAEGSTTRQKNGQALEFTIVTNNSPLNVKSAQLLKEQWEAIGFKINLNILTIGELEQNFLQPREYETLLSTENVGADPDPYAFWHSSQRANPGLNLAGFASREADQLILEARSNSDPSYRQSRYQRFQELVSADIPAVFMVNSLFVYGVSTKIHGIELRNIVNPSERFLDISRWYTKTKRVFK